MRVPLNELLFALSRALDFVERELLGVTTNHGKRAAYVSARICERMGLGPAEVFDMACCAILHDNALTAYMLDAGPGGIGRLEHFRNHCVKGEQNATAFPFAGDTSGIILHHHENWDGSGFHGLSGREIPLRASVLRLADNMDLELRMGDGRAALLDEIREHAAKLNGTVYAPETVEALLQTLDEDFVFCLADENIDQTLRDRLPALEVNLSVEHLLRVCDMFAFIIDAKSPFTRNHSRGMAEKVSRLARVYGISGERRHKMVIAAYLHDVGKLSTPVSILEKPGPLTDEEFAIMRDHASVTREILSQVSGLEEITEWSAHHHEKLNGHGYPLGSGAKELCFEQRLLTCCDIYQALTEDRPYRAGLGHEKAMEILDDMATKGELDPRIVNDIRQEFSCPEAPEAGS